MHAHRRTATAAVLLATAAALTSCGFDYPTDRVNQIAAGANDRSGSVDVLGARVLATADGHGRLIGSLANNGEDPAALTDVSGDGITLASDISAEVPGRAVLNLAGDEVDPIMLSGDYAAGEVVSLTYQFDTAETLTLDVPVVKKCFQYADIDVPEPPVEEEQDETTEAETDAAEETGDQTYICDHPTPEAGEEGE